MIGPDPFSWRRALIIPVPKGEESFELTMNRMLAKEQFKSFQMLFRDLLLRKVSEIRAPFQKVWNFVII